jgi:Spy/CpxP family protein refolding chaperone
MKRILTLTMAAALMIGSAMAQETSKDKKEGKHKQNKEWKKKGSHGKHNRGEFAKDLNLTDAQKQQFKSINEEYRAKFKALRSNDNATVGDVKKQSEALRKEQQEKMQNILTADQKAKMQELRSKKQTGSKAKGEKRFEEMQNDLNLSNDQATKLKSQNEAFRNKMQAIRDNKTLSQEQKKEQVKALAAEHKESLKSVLTAEQLDKMKANRKDGGKRKSK